MKKLDVPTLHMLANFVFPDDHRLALFNLSTDLMSGTMPYVVVDGATETIEADNDIAVAIGFTTAGAFGTKIDEIFDDDHAEQREVLLALIRKLVPAPQPKEDFSLPRPPFTLAAIVACEGKDGRIACAVFRHPGLTHDQALVVLTNLIAGGPETPKA